MKIQEVLTEMAWPDKFNTIEQKVRKNNMTISELIDMLGDEMGIYVHVSSDPQVGPFEMGNAAITPQPIPDEEGAPQELVGKRVLQIELGPGPTPDTPVAEVINMLPTLRHELTHYRQGIATKQEDWPPYINPDDDPFSPQTSFYMLQSVERPAQAVDLAQHLADVGATPDDFVNTVDKIYRQISKMDGISSEQLINTIKDAGSSTFNFNFDDHHDSSAQHSSIYVKVGQSALLKAISEHIPDQEMKRKIKGQQHQFIKLLKKRFPKVKGYKKQHDSHNKQALANTKKERKSIGKQQREMMDMLGMLNQMMEG